MKATKNKYRVLVISQSDKIYEYITEILPLSEYEPPLRAHDAGEAKRMLMSTSFHVAIINTPLPDDFGIDTALDLVEDSSMGILLLVKSDIFSQVCYKVEDSGIATLAKPTNKHELYGAIKIMTAVNARLEKMDQKNRSLQEKMADIRSVNRAKWLLIENLNMTEKEAHYYIEKEAMDTRLSRKQVAEHIIRTYDT